MKFISNQSGYLMIFALVFTAILMTALAGLIGYSQVNRTAERQTVARQQALYLAEAGVDRAIKRLNEDPNYAGEMDAALGAGSFSISVSSIDQFTKRLTATGEVPYPNGGQAERVIEATANIDSATVSFTYGVQAGNGGFYMGNNSEVNGNIFSNGNVSGEGSVTGDVSVAAGAAATADQEWTTQNADFLFGHINQRTAVAQSFVPSQTNTLAKVSVFLKKIGSPGNLTVQIVTNSNGSPSKTVLASGSISAALVTNNYAFVEGALNTIPSLAAGQTYWLMLVSAVNSSNYYSWGMDQAVSSGKYSAKWDAGNPVWNLSGGKYNFKTYLGGAVTALQGISIAGTARATVMSDCAITGDAHFDTSNTCTVQGQQFSGMPAPPPAPYPISAAQIADWEAAAEAGGVIEGDYTLDDQTITIGPKKINGNLTVINNSIAHVTGPIWVNGDITLNNNVQIILDSSLGNAGAAIIAHYPASTTLKGKMFIGNNSSVEGNGQPASWPLLVSMYAGAGNAIDLNNNAANTIFFAPDGAITISNNTGVKEMTAYQINMSNNSMVNYESGLQNAHFSTGPGGSWVYKRGSYAIVR